MGDRTIKSIIQDTKECFLCSRVDCLESHHIFGGFNREHSEKYGLKVWLCHWCHNEPPNGVHHNKETMQWLHLMGQKAFENTYIDLDFTKIFGRNYI